MRRRLACLALMTPLLSSGCATLFVSEFLPAPYVPAGPMIRRAVVEGASTADVGTKLVAYAALRMGDGSRRVYRLDSAAVVPALPRSEGPVVVLLEDRPAFYRERLLARDGQLKVVRARDDGSLERDSDRLGTIDDSAKVTLIGVVEATAEWDRDEVVAMLPAPGDATGGTQCQRCVVLHSNTESSGPVRAVSALLLDVPVLSLALTLDVATLPVQVVGGFVSRDFFYYPSILAWWIAGGRGRLP